MIDFYVPRSVLISATRSPAAQARANRRINASLRTYIHRGLYPLTPKVVTDEVAQRTRVRVRARIEGRT